MDPHKIRVADGALRVEVDSPEDLCLEQPVGILRGWFATRDAEIPETFDFRVGGITLPYRVVPRMDVEAAMPGHIIVGFTAWYELSSYLPYIQRNRLVIHLMVPGYEPFPLRFKVEESALAICLAAASEV